MSFAYPVVYDQFKRPEEAFEKVSDETITESAGYVSSDRQIEDMIMAGRRLNEARAESYDFPGRKFRMIFRSYKKSRI